MEVALLKTMQFECNDLAEDGLVMQAELVAIIKQQRINTMFQPIFDIESNNIFAYEALSRGPADSPLFQADMLFATAHDCRMTGDLDYVCRRKAVENFAGRNLPGKLALNICPSVLVDPDFRSGRTLQMLQEAGLGSERVILELTEHMQTDISSLKAAVEYYKGMGFSIAMDDLGAGYSNLRLLAELQPDYLKLDKFFVSGVSHDRVEADFVKLIVDLANRVGCRVIAEGIETVDDLQFVQSMDIRFGQGYLLGRPQAQAATCVPEILMVTAKSAIAVSDANVTGTQAATVLCESECIGSMRLHQTKPCAPDDSLNAVLNRFKADAQLQVIAVVDRGCVVGAVMRDELFEAFSMPYAHSLYRKSPVSQLMLKQPLVVDVNDALSEASRRATSRLFNLVYCPLIVCDKDKYVGMLSIRALLEKITLMQVEHALHCNPLTGLSGNVRIASEVQLRMNDRRGFVLSHFDLDNFKAFNDKYGYERGDQMIGLVAELLRDAAHERDFVGHIGGDDFVMVLCDDDWEARIWSVLNAFSIQSRLLYNHSERDKGFIEAADRLGHIRQFPMASLSVSAVTCPPGRFDSHLEASEVIAEIKHRSKKIEGNSLVVDRRDTA
ncbi:MAG: hypothetical protein AUJ57_07895 [Zetaproteobacteria bacterium CG1_02_53_45]|nr:MAG: hypothetical protein AUJ57_07895 [Zetaproteobacteria bacterium CG1_02_53_45]